MEKESHRKFGRSHKTKNKLIFARKPRILGTVVAICGVVVCLILLSKVDQALLDKDITAKRGKFISEKTPNHSMNPTIAFGSMS